MIAMEIARFTIRLLKNHVHIRRIAELFLIFYLISDNQGLVSIESFNYELLTLNKFIFLLSWNHKVSQEYQTIALFPKIVNDFFMLA